MSNQISDPSCNLIGKATESLRELLQALNDSTGFLVEAADMIEGDELVSNALRSIADERKGIAYSIGGFLPLHDEQATEDVTLLGNLHSIWTSFRAGLNSGDATVVLIEAERAEAAVIEKFEEILPEFAGTPVNNEMLDYSQQVRDGYEQIRGFRNAYENA